MRRRSRPLHWQCPPPFQQPTELVGTARRAPTVSDRPVEEESPETRPQHSMWAGTEAKGPPCPEDSASLCSHIFFSWIGPLLRDGYRRPLNEGDVFEPPASDRIGARTERIRAELERAASKSGDQRDSGARELLKALLAADEGCFLRTALLRPIWLACVVLQVVSLRFIGAYPTCSVAAAPL